MTVLQITVLQSTVHPNDPDETTFMGERRAAGRSDEREQPISQLAA